jgi:type I restriction enzyme, S subunit
MNDKFTWPRVKFGEVVKLNTDRSADPLADGLERYVGLEHIEPEDLRIRGWGLVAEGTTFTNRFRPGQTLFGKRRAYQRKVAVADFEGVCSSDIYVFEPKDDRLLPDLLPFLCQTEGFFEHAVGTSAGSLSPRTNWTQLANYEFALPPLEEQRRIAEILSAAVLAKEELQALIERANELWQSTASNYFAQNGIAFKHSLKSNTRLGDLLEYASDGPFGSKLKTEHYTTSGVQVIRLQNIKELDFDNSDRTYISETYYQDELIGYTVKVGDVLIAGLGDESVKAGRACIAPDLPVPAINKADCYCLRPRKSLSSEFLVCFLNSPAGLLQSISFAQGTTRLRLNLGNIKRMHVPFPSLDTQLEIADVLFSIHGAKINARDKCAKQQLLTSMLLNRLLKAETHV